jgi:hypothetical protein
VKEECPEELLNALAEVLTAAILRIRSEAYKNDAARCAVEADHVHNLPALLRNPQIALVRYYWNTERVSFVQNSAGIDVRMFQPMWETIASYCQ